MFGLDSFNLINKFERAFNESNVEQLTNFNIDRDGIEEIVKC